MVTFSVTIRNVRSSAYITKLKFTRVIKKIPEVMIQSAPRILSQHLPISLTAVATVCKDNVTE
jgi:hypothetical protein